MDPGVERRLREIDDALACLSKRVCLLEAAERSEPTVVAVPDAASRPSEPQVSPSRLIPERSHGSTRGNATEIDLVGILSLAGRTLVVLGGAFLLRALTDSGRLSIRSGLALGLTYAAVWLVTADFAQRQSGLFHGIAAILIGMPLVWEASSRFHAFSPVASASALLILSGSTLAVAWHKRLPGLAAAASGGTIATALVLILSTGTPLPFAVILIVIGLATLWISYGYGWVWLRWPIAFAADLILFGLIGRAVVSPPLEAPRLVVATGLLLVTAYLGSFVVRTLVQGQRVQSFEVFQSAVSVTVGLAGAMFVARAAGFSTTGLTGLIAVLGGLAYAAAFVGAQRVHGQSWNFGFYMTLGLALSLMAICAGLTGPPRTLALTILALLATWLARRFLQPVLSLHGAVFVFAAAVNAALFRTVVAAWFGQSSSGPQAFDTHGWVVLAASFSCLALLCVDEPVVRAGALLRVARLMLSILVLAGFSSAIMMVTWDLAGTPPSPGVLASLRTCILALAVVLLALASRILRLVELRWLTHAALIFGAAKVLIEDFRSSAPATLFLALGLFGAALVIAPRLMRRRHA